MKKHLYLFVFCVILVSNGFSQVLYELRIEQGENYPSCVFNTDDDDTLVGLFFRNEPCKLIKINKEGMIVDSLLFDAEDYGSVWICNIIKAEQHGHYLALREKLYQSKCFIVVCEFDNDFNVLWEKTIDSIQEGSVFDMGGQFLNGYYYIYTSLFSGDKAYFYKINTEGELFHSAAYQNCFFSPRFMTHIPNTDSFIINTEAEDFYLDVINTDLEIDTGFWYNGNVVGSPNLEFINDSIFVTSGMGTEGPWGNYQDRLVIKATNFNETLGNPYASVKMTIFGEEGIGGSPWYPGCRTGDRRALAMHDNYFFFAGTGLFNNSMGPFYDTTDNFVMVYAFDHNLDSLWAIHLGYDAYYLTWSIAPTIDGGCVVIAYYYDWRGSGTMESYIVRIAKDFEVSIPETEKPNPFATVFPNPGNNRFLIQTELANFTLQLYDMQGQLRLTQQNRKEVNTEKLPSGCYIYRIIAENGKATNGKWVKK